MDDLEFEVTPTDTGWQRAVRGPVRTLLPRRPPLALTVSLVALCVVLVTGILVLASVPGLSGRVDTLLHGTPTPTPRLAPGGDLLYVEGGFPFPWGQLTVNGKLVAIDQYISGGAPTPLTLRRGVTTIEYQADPFPVVRCRITVPARPSDTCPLDHTYPSPDALPFGARRALRLTPSLDALATGDRHALVQAVSTFLVVTASPTALWPGEHYVDASRHLAVAATALRVQYVRQLASGSAGDPCASLCVPSLDPQSVPRAASPFMVQLHLIQGYTYTDAAGHTVLADAPLTDRSDVPVEDTLLLDVTWNGSWQIALDPQSTPDTTLCLYAAGLLALHSGCQQQTSFGPLCLLAAHVVQDDYANDPATHTQVHYLAGVLAAQNPLDGCLLRILGSASYDPQSPGSPYLLVLYRFGVLLAVDDQTAAAFPELPRADAAEVALAQQIGTTSPPM